MERRTVVCAALVTRTWIPTISVFNACQISRSHWCTSTAQVRRTLYLNTNHRQLAAGSARVAHPAMSLLRQKTLAAHSTPDFSFNVRMAACMVVLHSSESDHWGGCLLVQQLGPMRSPRILAAAPFSCSILQLSRSSTPSCLCSVTPTSSLLAINFLAASASRKLPQSYPHPAELCGHSLSQLHRNMACPLSTL
ncbi:hypothetical protein BDW69DRAFT_65615 [Aspergillus filifer]